MNNLIFHKLRAADSPNRVYLAKAPVMKPQTEGRGDFSGGTVQETQPIPADIEWSDAYTESRKNLTITANVIHVLGAAVLFLAAIKLVYAVIDIANAAASRVSDAQVAPMIATLFATANWLFLASILRTMAKLLSELAHISWSELLFRSTLFMYQCEGMYAESKVTIGKAVFDTAQTDNVVTRSSITFKLLASDIVSSTFARLGANSLSAPRHVVCMRQSENAVATVIDEMKKFAQTRASITAIDNEHDMESVKA